MCYKQNNIFSIMLKDPRVFFIIYFLKNLKNTKCLVINRFFPVFTRNISTFGVKKEFYDQKFNLSIFMFH